MWFLKKKKEVAYYSNYILDLEESEEMHLVLAQSKIDRRSAENMYSAIKLIYEDGLAKEIIPIEEGEYEEKEKVRYSTKPISHVNYPINVYKTMVLDPFGHHRIGGQCPADFKIPESKCQAPFVYLGYLDCQVEESLDWTRMGQFHMIFPLHTNLDVLYLDYSNPQKPLIHNADEIDQQITHFKGMNSEDKIIFKENSVSMEDISLDRVVQDEILGKIGAPDWIQHELIPRCPKTGKPMKFLVMLESSKLIELKSSTVQLENETYIPYVSSFEFGSWGALYIFIEPESKMVAAYIQNT